MKVALVGVISTLAGTVLGWVLNWLSHRGKIKIFVDSFQEIFRRSSIDGYKIAESYQQADIYSYTLKLDIYNSCADNRIMRDIAVVFAGEDAKNKILYRSTPKDARNEHDVNACCQYGWVEPINMPPKSILQLTLIDGIDVNNGAWNFWPQTTEIYLTYTDEKKRPQKVVVMKKQKVQES